MLGTCAPTPADIGRFRAFVAARLGLDLSRDRSVSLARLLERRVRVCRLPLPKYLDRLERDAEPDETQALARALTIPETYFFRHADQFRALADVALPERFRARQAQRALRIRSLGCASGEEAYSLAITARTVAPDYGWQLDVTGADVNAAALEKARRGRYTAWSLRAMPGHEIARWFRRSGRTYVLDEALRTAVRFEQLNLAADGAVLAADCDVIFLRNVLMYFTPDRARVLVARVRQALAPGGYLFLGHAETLRGLSEDFELRHTHGTFYYQRPVSGGPGAIGGDAQDGQRSLTVPSTAAGIVTETSRQHATSPRPAHAAASPPTAALAPLHEQARELMALEQFDAATALLDALPESADDGLELRLLKGVALLQQGAVGQAADVARDVIASDHRHIAAHHLLALCLEGTGDAEAAARQWRTCVHLEPAAGLARLHLGRLARRAGEPATAQRELAAALLLLPSEPAERVALFGGGFSRAALVDLCRAELAHCRSDRA